MAATPTSTTLKFTGSKHLIQRLVLATLTGKPLRISQIRSSSHTSPGLAPHEVSFLRLLEALTNGSQIEFSYTGTTVLYKPGLITGSATGHGAQGGVIRHEVPDTVRTAILPVFKSFGIERDLEVRILRRSNAGTDGKGGGGEVQLVFGHQVRLPRTVHLMSAGRVKRVRGVAYSTGVAGANNARLIEAARGVLNEVAPDTYIFSDVSAAPFVPAPTRENPAAKRKTGLGFGLSLVAETNTGALYSADVASPPAGGEPPEDLGRKCAFQLLEAIEQGGCVSSVAAPTLLTLMAMGSEDVGRVALGKEVLGSEQVVQLARDLRTFGMSGWGLRDGDEEDSVVVSIVGKGVGNVGRKIA
ncbi:hypothetical protein LTR12_006235 [Friedmanniomyces endolithicus]|nr:hypothetical protein LTR74_005521 [Friedmanniomyces endolithicus]KAK1819288.1 hypothetical protein LTR12_006235 [Friedmanniomyces endolithicus]